MNRKIISTVLVLALLFGLTGCTTYENFRHAWMEEEETGRESTIKIGIYEPLSGQLKGKAEEELSGIDMAYEKVNQVLGRKIDLIYADNKSNIYDGETAMEELMTSKPSVVLGSYGETLTLVASDYLKATMTPGITISSRNPLITSNNEYFFVASFSETKQGRALAEFAYKKMHKDTFATVRLDNDDRAQAIVKRFTSKINRMVKSEEDGSDEVDHIVGNFLLSSDEVDYSETIEKIRTSGAKAVLLSVAPVVAKEFLKQCEEKNLTHVMFLGITDWEDKGLIKFIKSSEKLQAAYVSGQVEEKVNPQAKNFIEAYKRRYGEDAEPSVNAALAYDAYMMTIKAIEEAYKKMRSDDVEALVESAETEAEGLALRDEYETAMRTGIPSGRMIKDALSNIKDYEGVSGNTNYDGKNEATKSITINAIIGGKEQPPYISKKN